MITNINYRSVCEKARESWGLLAELGKWANIKNSIQFELFIQSSLHFILSNLPFATSEIFFPPWLLGFFNIVALIWEKSISPFVTSSYILTLKEKSVNQADFQLHLLLDQSCSPGWPVGWISSHGPACFRVFINKLIGLKKGTWCEEKALRRTTWTKQ